MRPPADPSLEGDTSSLLNVSVVLPVGSVDSELSQQLDALDSQDFAGSYEIVLSLNTDDPEARSRLVALAKHHPRTRIVDASDTRSAAYARNFGARAAGSPILAFCDGDDLVDPAWLKNLSGAVAPGRAVGGHLEEEKLAVSGQENWRPPATPGALPQFLGHDYIVSANFGVYRDDFLAAGGFDLSLLRGEDIALSFSLTRQGVDLIYMPDAVVHYRHRKGLWRMIHQHYLYGRGMAQVLGRFGTPGDSTGRSVLGTLRPNSQAVARWSGPHLLRRMALGLGRLVGTLEHRWRG